jgi:ketosteroid isomerase-like protein
MTNAEDEIRALFTRYAEGFDDADASAIVACFAWPATIWQFGTGHVFEEPEDLAENVEMLIAVFDEAGIVLTHPEVQVVTVAGEAAFASLLWHQEDDQGEVVHQFACQYLLVHEAGVWRIASIVNEEGAGEEGEAE